MLALDTLNAPPNPRRPSCAGAEMETKRAGASVTQANDAGVFEGYASVFGVLDTGGDIVLPGAFARSLRKRGAAGVKMLWQHKTDEPIGVWTSVEEDARGLKVRGRLDLSVARAREALSLMRSGAVDGISIGFRTLRATTDKSSGARRLEEIDLWEISLVTFPMLPQARVSKVKRQAVSIDHVMAQLVRLKAHRAAERFEAKLLRFALERRYDPNQSRAPTGSPEGGQWTSGGRGGNADGAEDESSRGESAAGPGVSLAGKIISACIAEGIFRWADNFGNRRWKATYECRGGRTITREGLGEAPGLILDPFQ